MSTDARMHPVSVPSVDASSRRTTEVNSSVKIDAP